ncbi:MAG: hypothetical protein U5J96_00230 [Ignavibacteriaceae bacterium]|nr:hypothetical protein [Ignavibacteriaceae bacterium]
MKHKLLSGILLYLVGFTISFAQVDIGRSEAKYLSDTNKTGSIDLKSDLEIQRLSELKS